MSSFGIGKLTPDVNVTNNGNKNDPTTVFAASFFPKKMKLRSKAITDINNIVIGGDTKSLNIVATELEPPNIKLFLTKNAL